MKKNALAYVVVAIVVALGAVSCDDGPGSTPPRPPTPEGESATGPSQPSPQALPDFAIGAVSRTPNDPVAPGTTCRFSVSVVNRGNRAYGGRIVVSGPGNYSGSFQGLDPGQTKVATIDYPVHSPNVTYNGIVFTVDPDNVIQESNETNNSSGQYSIRTSP